MPEGNLVEVELVSATTRAVMHLLDFSPDLAASFGDDLGQQIPGHTEVTSSQLFADGFESGDLTIWSGTSP